MNCPTVSELALPSRMVRPGIRLGVDLGGTKIEAALIECSSDASVHVLQRRRIPTPKDEGYEAVLGACAGFVLEVAREAPVAFEDLPIGAGMPGGIRRRDGLVKNSNTTCLNGRPFRADLQHAVGRAITFDNDANCFALAEALLGAARSAADGVVFGVIMGTGVGGGVVTAGRVWPGLQGIAGEWGHHAVYAVPAGNEVDLRPCYCGQRGCLETWLSGPAVEREYGRRTGKSAPLAEIAARRARDADAQACIEGLVDAFGRGLANVIDILDPSMVVLGGGVSNLALLLDEGAERVRRYVFNDELVTPIVRHELGDSAGVFGAALLGMIE